MPEDTLPLFIVENRSVFLRLLHSGNDSKIIRNGALTFLNHFSGRWSYTRLTTRSSQRWMSHKTRKSSSSPFFTKFLTTILTCSTLKNGVDGLISPILYFLVMKNHRSMLKTTAMEKPNTIRRHSQYAMQKEGTTHSMSKIYPKRMSWLTWTQAFR